jgi:hypothetical protein
MRSLDPAEVVVQRFARELRALRAAVATALSATEAQG